MSGTPVREQILTALLSRLATVPGVPTGSILRDPSEPVETVPALVLRDLGEVATPDFSGEDAYTLSFDVEIYAGGNDDAASLAALSGLRAQVDKALAADPTLGGRVRRLEPRDEPPPTPGNVDGHPNIRAAARGYEIDYATREGDPFAFA